MTCETFGFAIEDAVELLIIVIHIRAIHMCITTTETHQT
jgi:hypothetical protein